MLPQGLSIPNPAIGGSLQMDGEEPDGLPEPIDSCCAAEVPQQALPANGSETAGSPVDNNLGENQEINSDEDMTAVMATMSQAEMRMVFEGFVNTGSMTDDQKQLLKNLMEGVLAQRDAAGAAEEVEAAPNTAAAAASVSTETAAQMQQKAREDAEAKVAIAVKSIDEAEKACGGHEPDLVAAKNLLQAQTQPLAAGAAQAQRLIHKVLGTCPTEAEKAVKKADRDVRDVVVLRCRAECEDPKDRDGFLVKATEAYNGELDKEVRAQLLLAYHKDPTNQRCGFISNNQVAADRRGGPRPRRRRHSPGKRGEDGLADHELEDQDQATAAAEGAASTRARAEPMKIVPSLSLQEAADSTVEYSYFWQPPPERLHAVQGETTSLVPPLHWGTSVEANKKDTPANSSPDLLDVGPWGLEAEKDEKAAQAGRREPGRSCARQLAVPMMPYPYAQQFLDVNWNWHGYNMNAQAMTRPEHYKWQQGSASSSHETWMPAQGAKTTHYSV